MFDDAYAVRVEVRRDVLGLLDIRNRILLPLVVDGGYLDLYLRNEQVNVARICAVGESSYPILPTSSLLMTRTIVREVRILASNTTLFLSRCHRLEG